MMLSRMVTAVCAAALIAASCAAAQRAPVRFVAKELGLRQAVPTEADFERPFEAPLPARVSSGQGGPETVPIASCRAYLAVRDRIVGSDNDADYRVLRFQGVACEALALLKVSTDAKRSALPADFASLTATRLYPATLWPAISDEERETLARPGSTLRTASDKGALRVTPGGGLELESQGMGLRLTLLARGDFDHDGWEDAAFRWEAWSLKGSYADSRLVVLTRKDRALRELVLEKILSGH